MVIIGQDRVLQAEARAEGWPAEDPNRALLRATIRVANLEDSIKFYTRYFDLRLRVPLDVPGSSEQRACLAASDVPSAFCLELVQDASLAAPRPGDWFSHFTLVVPATTEVLTRLRAAGREDLIVDHVAAVIPVRSSSPEGGQSTQDLVAVVRDPDGYRWRVMEARSAPEGEIERLCTVALRVGDLQRAVDWASTVIGTEVHQQYIAPKGPEYKTALVGLGGELRATQLELRQTEEPPRRDRGTGFIRCVVGTASLEATRDALRRAGEEWEEAEIGSVAEAGAMEPALRCLCPPDGWEFCFVAATAAAAP